MASAPQLEDTATEPVDGTPAAPEPTVEDIAKEGGWKPKDEYTGDPTKWKPAAEYVRGTFSIRDHFKQSSKGLKSEVERLTKTVDTIVKTGAKQTARALEAQAAEINARFAEAVENKDTKGAAKAAADMQVLTAEARAVNDDPKDAVAAFQEANSWYGSDRKATAFAKLVCEDAAAEGLDVKAQLARVDTEMRKEFPDLYNGNPAPTPGRKAQASVEPPSRATAPANRQDYASMPDAMKKAANEYAEMFVSKGLVKDKQEAIGMYVKDYYASQG